MSNSIDPFADSGLHRLAGRRTPDTGQGADDKANAAAQSEQASDLLNLTGRAKELQTLQQDLAKSPEFDSARVSELKEAIANGNYQVNADRIAEKLLAVESKLP